MKFLKVAKWLPLLAIIMALSTRTALPAAPTAAARIPAPAKPDTSRATQRETIDWICQTLTSRKPDVFPWGDERVPVIVEKNASYSASENQLTISFRITPTEYVKKQMPACLFGSTAVILLAKLNDLVAIDKTKAASIVVFCRSAIIDLKDPGKSLDSSLGGQFHEVSDVFGSHLDAFVDRVSIPFETVNRAERAAAAFRHLASLAGGAPPVKPAHQPF